MTETTELKREIKELKAQVKTLGNIIGYILKDLNIHFDEVGGTIPALMDRVYGLEVTVNGLVSGMKDAANIMEGEPIERREVN